MLHPVINDNPYAGLSDDARRSAEAAVGKHWSELLPQAIDEARRAKQLTPAMVSSWHRALLSDVMGDRAGVLRTDPGDVMALGFRGGWIQQRYGGVPLETAHEALEGCCRRLSERAQNSNVPPAVAAQASGWLYARIWRLAPFSAGNEMIGHFSMLVSLALMGYEPIELRVGEPRVRQWLASAMPERGGTCTIKHLADAIRALLKPLQSGQLPILVPEDVQGLNDTVDQLNADGVEAPPELRDRRFGRASASARKGASGPPSSADVAY